MADLSYFRATGDLFLKTLRHPAEILCGACCFRIVLWPDILQLRIAHLNTVIINSYGTEIGGIDEMWEYYKPRQAGFQL